MAGSNDEVLRAISDLRSNVDTRHNALDRRMDELKGDNNELRKTVKEVFVVIREDTKQHHEFELATTEKINEVESNASAEIGKVKKEIAPAVDSAKNVKKGMWIMLVSLLGTIGAWIGSLIIKAAGNGGQG